MLALALGLLCLGFLPALPSVGWLVLLAVAGGAGLFTRLWPLGCFLLGLCWACWSAQQALDDRLAAGLDGRTLWLEGQVVGLPTRTAQGVRFELDAPRSRRAELPQRLQLSWFDGPPLRTGEQWRLAVTLQRPAGLLNPHGPDREAQLLARRVGATGTVKAGQLLAPVAGGWRDTLRQHLLAVEAHGQQAALVALVLGDGAGLAREDWQTLQATGTVHLLVISGQHIGLVAGLLYGLVAWLARWGLWPARLPWLPCACGLAMTAALAYGWLAGAGVPVQRACLMLAVVLFWRLRYRHLGATLPLLLALDAVLLVEPLAALLPGFWLSFAAVATLVYCFSARLGGWRPWQAWTRAQWVIAIGLLPVLLATGLPVSLSAPLANLVAVPWISLVVLPLALLGTLLLPLGEVGEALLWLAGGAARCAVPAAGAGRAAAVGVAATSPAVVGLVAGVPGRSAGSAAPWRAAAWFGRHHAAGPVGAQGAGAFRASRGLADGRRPGAGGAVAHPPSQHALRRRAGQGRERPGRAGGVANLAQAGGGQPGPDAHQPCPCRPCWWCWGNPAWPAGQTGDRRRSAG